MRHRLSQALCAVALGIAVLGQGLVAARAHAADDLSDAYLLPDLFQIMADEGIKSLTTEGGTLLSGFELTEWTAHLPRLYDPQRMQATFMQVLEQQLAAEPDLRAHALDFARSDLGQRILQLEITARRALLSDEIDAMARDFLTDARDAAPDATIARRLEDVRQRIAANDLIELNVSLGLNTSYAYYMGMLDEGATAGMTEPILLQLVWGQEPAIREDVTDWIESYFLLAYQPLSDDDLQKYIAYSQSPQGDAFNRAMFAAFDAVFVSLSREVGRALGQRLNAEPL